MKKESPCRTGQSEKQILTGSAATLPHPLDEGQDLMLTKEDLAVKLKVALRTIENWQHEGYLPFIKIANVVLFYWPTVLLHLQTHFSVSPRGVVTPALPVAAPPQRTKLNAKG